MPNKSLPLSSYGILRPEKINWRFLSVNSEIVSQVRSKSLRRFLSRVSEIMSAEMLTAELKELTKEEFIQWLPYYKTRMEENHYELLATEQWYEKKVSEGKTVHAVLIKKAEELVGTLIYTENAEKSSIAFRANDKLDLIGGGRSSVGAILDYLFVREMVKKSKPVISAGRSRNAFGVINTIGNLDYKLRFGYSPIPYMSLQTATDVPVNEEGIVLFYGTKNGKLSLYGVTPAGSSIIFEAERFSTSELPFEHIQYTHEQLVDATE